MSILTLHSVAVTRDQHLHKTVITGEEVGQFYG